MDTNTSLLELQIDQTSHFMLRESAKWAKFLSIVGFILCGIFVLIGIFAGRIYSNALESTSQYGGSMPFAMGSMMTVVYVIWAVIYFFPCLFLFRFGSRMQVALGSNDQQQLGNSLGSLRAYFRFVGILTIIALAFCVLAFVFGILGAIMTGIK